jgi:hypothetical protein
MGTKKVFMASKFVVNALLVGYTVSVGAITSQDLLKSYEAQSGKALSSRGEQFFNTKHGKEWSCASCHDNPPIHDTKHIVTGKAIKPLAPSANPARFTDQAIADKWFKRNCNDVLGRECAAQEKADVLSWLISVK